MVPPMCHSFRPADSANWYLQCSSCDVIADETVADRLEVPCPAPLCTEPSNHGEPCVFIEADGVECAYCGRWGDPEERDDDQSDFFTLS